LSLNALAGIFCFGEFDGALEVASEPLRLNALAGIFCFGVAQTLINANVCVLVSMPSRAFFVLGGHDIMELDAMLRKGLNALAGIFCFGENLFCHSPEAIKELKSQCPRGHFLFWGYHLGQGYVFSNENVSMPSRAFFVLGCRRARRPGPGSTQSLNALAGIFCFGVR